MGTKFSGSNAAPEKSSPENVARFLVSKIGPATGVMRVRVELILLTVTSLDLA